MELDIEFAELDDSEILTPDKGGKKFDVPANLAKVFSRHKLLPVPAAVDRMAVFGSRTLRDDRVLKLIDQYVLQKQSKIIVTAAEPAGICTVAQKYAREKKIPLQVHFLQGDKYAKGMHEHRSDAVINASDCVLFIHDGISKGTYNEILRTIHFRKPFIYEKLEDISKDEVFCDV